MSEAGPLLPTLFPSLFSMLPHPLPVTSNVTLRCPLPAGGEAHLPPHRNWVWPSDSLWPWHVNGCDTSEDLKHTSGLALLLLTLLSSPQEKHVPASLLVQEMWSRPASDLQLEERCSQPQATPTDQTPR